MAIKTIRVFQEFTSAGYVPMPVAGNIDYGVTIANTFPATTPATFQTDDPDIDVTLTATTDYYVWIRSHGTDWNPMYTRNVRVYPDSPLINNVVMGLIIANLDGTVPYTGATTNVNLGEHGLTTGYLNFDLTPSATPTTASTLSWNDGNGTLEMVMLGGNVKHQIGQEILARAYNAETTTLNKGEIIYIHGAQGNRISVKRASSTLETTSSVTIGIVAETIPAGNEGFIMSQGTLGKLNTSALSQGTALWLGTTPGTYTSVKPVAPVNSVLIGYVERVHATVGSIYVKIQNGYELEELHNVLITSVANKNTLVYDSTAQVWKNRNIFGTQGYMPYYDDTLLMKDSVIFTNGTNVGISSTSLTEKLVVGGNILATAFKKVGGLSTEFLKADGSSDATAYQPLSADLTAIDNLALTTGLLRKNGSDNWELDQTEYLSVPIAISTYQTLANLSSNLTASTTKYPSVNAVNAGLALKLNLTGGTLTGGLTLNYSYPNIALSDVSSGTTWNIQNDGSTFKLNYGATNNFYIFSSGNAAFVNSLTASSLIKSGGTSTQFLKADGSVDNTNYQPYDADLASIAGLELTTGLLRKNGLNTYTLDQTEYVALSTANSTYQTLANLQSNLNASSTKYPSVNAVNTGLNLKLNLAGGTLTGDLALAYSYPNIQLNDTGSGTIWNIQNDGGGLEFNSGTTNKFVMYSSGNATFVNDLTANKFIKVGGTSAQFLMADGSVSSGNAGTVTSVGLSAPTGFSVSGSPVTTSGTLALAFSAGYSLPTISSQGNWDTAYNRSLTSIGVSGTTTKTLTLTKQDGSTLTASWSDINTDAVTSVFGRTGAIVATSGDYTTAQVTESGNLYYLDSRARASLSFVAGSGAYNSTTGVITIPTNNNQITNGAGYITGITSGMVTTALGYTPVTNARQLTINGTAYDLSADRSWTISGTIGGLTSGYIPKATSASTLGNSLLYDNGSNIHIGGTAAPSKLTVSGDIESMYTTSAPTVNYLKLGTYGNGAWGSYIGASSNYASTLDTDLRFGVSAGGTLTEAMRIFSNQNISIGSTTNAGYKLDVNGTARFTGQILIARAVNNNYLAFDHAGTNTWYQRITTDNTSSFIIRNDYNGGLNILTLANTGAATFSSSVSATSLRLSDGNEIGWGANTTFLLGDSTNNNFRFYTSNTEKMRLTSTGNLGLGTSSPGGTYGKLTVAGGIRILDDNNAKLEIGRYSAGASNSYIKLGANSNSLRFTNAGDLADIMELTNSGNLGLGVTPSAGGLSGYTLFEMSNGGTSIYSGPNQSLIGTNTSWSAGNPTYKIGNYASLYNQQSGQHQWYTAPFGVAGNAISFTQAMTLDASGRLGIGVTSMNERLMVNGAIVTNSYLNNNQTSSGVFDFYSGSTRIFTYGASGVLGNLEFHTSSGNANSTERMRLVGNGNLLIGTTTDSGYKLDVNGTGRVNGTLTISGPSAIKWNYSDNFGYFGIGYISAANYGFYNYNYGRADLLFTQATGAATFSSSVTAGGNITSGGGAYDAGGFFLPYSTASASSRNWKITNDQINFGDFSIKQSSTQSGLPDTVRFYISNAGNVGIGVTNPVYKLSISSSSNGDGVYYTDGTVGTWLGSLSSVATVGATTNHPLAFYTNGGERMRITSGGTVAIGLTSPDGGAKLDVNGLIRSIVSGGVAQILLNNGATQLSIDNNGGTMIFRAPGGSEGFRMSGAGNILMGTSTDSGYKLDVSGIVRVKNSSVGGTYYGQLLVEENGEAAINIKGVSYSSIYFGDAATPIESGIVYVHSTNTMEFRRSGNVTCLSLSPTGAATFSSSVTAASFFESSDKTLKTLLVNNYQAKGIESITAKLYTKHGKEELGYFAQDVQGILPSAVTKGTNGLLNLSYREVLVAKVQRLEKELEELKAKMN